ncbi:MAG: AzlD domain-containing protein [Pseudomonadota bacterium]
MLKMTDLQIVFFIATMSTATFLTRGLPFLLPKSATQSKFVQIGNRILPPAILTLLVMYSLKNTHLTSGQSALPAILALAAVIIVHIIKRNALLSILVGTALYMFLKQIIFHGL